MPLAIRDIEYFLAVARSGLISSTALELGLTQPALTKAVQRVEEEFGTRLFERSATGVRLNSAGLRVAGQLGRLQAQYADAMLLAGDMRASRAGLIRVGVTDITAGNRLSTCGRKRTSAPCVNGWANPVAVYCMRAVGAA